jgi:adenylate cyclase
LGEDPGIDCHAWAALSLWFLGYPDRALAQARLAVSLAKDPSRSYSLATTQSQLAVLHQLRQEQTATLEWANETIALARQQGYAYRGAVAQVLRGWALARMGQHEEGTRVLQEGMNGCAAMGAELDRPYYLALLAESRLIAGRPAEAAATLEDGLKLAAGTPNFFYTAELCRLRGIAAAQCREPVQIAERWLLRAIDVAASQGALSLELRAALSLAELAPPSAQQDVARARLTEILDRFTEGLDTPDLLQAVKISGKRLPSRRSLAAQSGK